MQVCIFSLGGRLLGVGAAYVREVFDLDVLTPVPTASPFVLGLASVRGAILPVIDSAPFVGAKARPLRGGDPLVRVEAGDASAALAAEKVLGVREVKEPATREIGSVVAGTVTIAEGEVMLLDLGALFERARA